MKYEDFEKFVREKCMYDTIYEDSDGRQILIVQMLDAYNMVDKALRARLAQPEQEPVAWITTWNEPNDAGVELHWAKQDKGPSSKHTPLYYAPPQREWVGLTKEEARELCVANVPYVVDMVTALEVKLKEKNT